MVHRVQRFAGGELTAPVSGVDLNEVVTETVALAEPQWRDEAQRRGARIVISLELDENALRVVGAKGPIEEALMSVLVNAIDASPEGGTITIRTHAAADNVSCAVTDTGVGMSDETRRRALEPFFTTKGPQRAGLGLSDAYGTIGRYGGALEIQSAEGQGTTVTVSLPRWVDAASLEASAPREPTVKRLRILVIDDEPEVRATLVDMLAADGHRVVEASGGREGIDRLASGLDVDLVLTDFGMPDMPGPEVARVIRERWPQLPVGLVTGWADTVLAPEQRQLVDFVVHKPFDWSLIERIMSTIAPRTPQ
jgi:CheY-like chemotaxis protein/anti-sigma regulatory factor (Ser/Thr protein kinase)